MNVSLFVVCAVALTSSQLALAQDADAPASRSRAEVRAEAELWSEAGLAEIYRGNMGPEVVFSPQFEQALRTYAALRASPRYQELVRKLSGAPG
ncbi:DUF4148 domain-containing protein [Variovorax sp. J22R133]|uniref:DUF4148 domain-containing protein n=1 Tax=Variovorax brevis TaxID=3053503 RepID=UPI0025790BF2|nr:DUF4148 domain-containing protein [Variovorax sp. J22R133]MDM0116933.1 DUF4148 domain-containing protein [Variovorax sp. J22R133]